MGTDDARSVGPASLNDVLITAALADRPQRRPDYEAESRALTVVAEAMAEPSKPILHTLVAVAKDLCRADSAGVSILDPERDVFFWPAIVGPVARFLGGDVPRHASPCGIVLDRDAPTLFAYPERHFHHDVTIDPPIVEALLAPFRAQGTPVGTLWAISHTPSRQFDSEDQRLLTSLARFAGLIADTTERLRSGEALQARLRQDLEDAKVLQRVSGVLTQDLTGQDLYEAILDAAITIMRADFGSIQMVDPQRRELHLLASRNLHPQSVEFWRTVTAERGTSCGWALRHGERVVIPDVAAGDRREDPDTARHCALSGIAAMQSSPLTTRHGRVIGMISTHWRRPHQPSEREFALFDVLVRQAADVLERLHAERAIRKQARLVQLSFDAIIVWTLDGTIESWNKGAELLYRYASDDAIGRNIHDLLRSVHPVPLAQRLAMLQARGSWEGELRHQTKDGGEVIVSARQQLIVDDGDGAVRVLETNRDVSDRKHAEQALSRSREALQIQMRQLRDNKAQLRRMASELTLSKQQTRESVAKLLHDDLQQVLFSAKLHVDRLRAVAKHASPQSQELANQAQEDLDQAIARARSLSMELSPPQLYDGDFSAALAWLATSMHERFGLSVEMKADPRATLDNNELRLLAFESVRELLFNVVKHAQVTRARLDVSLTFEDQLQIRVADAGIGFDPAAVLDPTRRYSSWGLFSIRERAELLGAHFHVESAAGCGTQFTLVLPREKLASGGTSDSLRLLIADDNVLARISLRDLLTDWPQFQIVGEAANGVEAVELAVTLQPDAIIMDVSMPEMDGVEATRRIHSAHPEIPVFGLSALTNREGRHPIETAGAVGYYSKGDSVQPLLERLLALHAHKRTSDRTA